MFFFQFHFIGRDLAPSVRVLVAFGNGVVFHQIAVYGNGVPEMGHDVKIAPGFHFVLVRGGTPPFRRPFVGKLFFGIFQIGGNVVLKVFERARTPFFRIDRHYS